MRARSGPASHLRNSNAAGVDFTSRVNVIIASALLQFYFLCNLLSFAIWEVGGIAAAHMTIYFGIWIAGSIAILSAYLRYGDASGRPRTTVAVLTVVSIPMFGIWIQSLELRARWLEWALLIAYPFFIYLYFRLGGRSFKKLTAIVVGLCALSLFSHVNLFKLAFSSVDQDPELEKYAAFELASRPNVHMIMFESLTASDFTKEFLAVENPAADYLSKMEDAIFAGNFGFAEEIPTRRSWSFIFNLGTKRSRSGSAFMFSGIHPSPLSELLNHNGYSIQTGYSSTYLGHRKGEHIDHYHIGIGRWHTVRAPFCDQKLLGYCGDQSGRIYDFLATRFYGKDQFELDSNSWEDSVAELIRRFENISNSPIFSAFHIYLPGHAPNNADLNEESIQAYTEKFESRIPKVAELIQEIDKLRQEFPESIFIISGDHGPWLFRKLKYEEDRRLFILGRHHVALALLNAGNLCDYERAWLEHQSFLSPARMLVASLSCNGEPEELLDGFPENSDFVEFGATLGAGETRSIKSPSEPVPASD